MLPELEYYDLSQLADRWESCVSNIQHYVETGKLASACWLDKCVVEYGRWKQAGNGFDLFEPHSISRFKGFVGIYSDDARLAFRDGLVENPHLYSLQDSSYTMRLVQECEFKLSAKNICVLHSEVVHFEAHFLKREVDVPFHFTDDYQTLYDKERMIRLGVIQAHVMRQLHEASQADNPWLYGKRLLDKAGSQSLQLKSLFRHQKHWRDWIESDGRGYYRLKLP